MSTFAWLGNPILIGVAGFVIGEYERRTRKKLKQLASRIASLERVAAEEFHWRADIDAHAPEHGQ